MDNPIELPNGQLVCRKHRLVICGYCTVDYSFMDEMLDNSDVGIDHDSDLEQMLQLGPKRTKGTGRVFPTVFTPPRTQARPAELFTPSLNRCSSRALRFINATNKHQALIYTDGACLNNGQPNPRAGWAFVFSPSSLASGRLENQGPFGGPSQPQTSNRAELRAVIAALRFRHWTAEGFQSVVIATDSEYVVNGATTWARGWVKNGWRTAAGAAVKNRDLWEMLLGEVERWDEEGLEVVFWRIGRQLNEVADAAAKKAAEEKADEERFMDLMGAAC
ncbi:hypothetical protein N0V82_010612 [Gnomoniopsis sp. IMI 355080]|nr:hypothetical protein N0V82_010612 [Gnomoniopsis sp. IMI 355080]